MQYLWERVQDSQRGYINLGVQGLSLGEMEIKPTGIAQI